MTIEEPEPNPTSDHLIDWLEGSVSYLPSFFDDPYNSTDIDAYRWWDESEDINQNMINTSNPNVTPIINTIEPASPTTTNPLPPPISSKKRRVSDDTITKTSQNRRKIQGRKTNQSEDGDASVEDLVALAPKKLIGNKKGTTKGTGNNNNNGNNKEGRWAEQLLNPCALAITSGNITRVQHLLVVLQELSSISGDANHRLAAFGLRALSHHLSSSVSSTSVSSFTFASVEPRFFQKSLLRFYEVSPWFAFPNNIANSCILQILNEASENKQNLHILDIGVSHGVQWPTLLEALSRRSGGPPPLVRITVIAGTIENDRNIETSFSIGPQGDNFSSRLLSFAKSLSINLQINRLDNLILPKLNVQEINYSTDETLIVCAQFRLHQLNHNNPDERSEFLKTVRDMKPKGVILSENNIECSCNNCGDFTTRFSRRVEYLWRFLDSTSTAFKGRESDERRLMEGEASKALTNMGEMNERKEKWCERMKGVGFVREIYGEDAIDGGRALLRKYDSNWEMRVDEKDGCVGLWWRGQPVSFCSLWKLHN